MRLWSAVALVGASWLWLTNSNAEQLLEIRSGLNALHQVQDEIARGSVESSQFQKVILDRVAESLEQLPDESLANPEHQLALVELALSGGERARVQKLIQRARGKGPFESLLSGVEAYLNGEMDKAGGAFEHEPAEGYGDSHADHFIALAKGTALLDADLPKAREAFEQAMLLAPGTLVEEVAIRRLTGISLKMHDPELFLRCANIYLRRYGESPFALEFMSSFVAGASLVTNVEDLARLGNVVMIIPAPTRRPLLSALTADLLIKGKIVFAEVFAARLRETSDDDGKVTERNAEFRLFDILTKMGGASSRHALTLLQNLEGKLADPDMQELLHVARHVAWNIHKPLKPPSGAQPDEAEKNAKIINDFADTDPILAQAKTVLERLGVSKGGTF